MMCQEPGRLPGCVKQRQRGVHHVLRRGYKDRMHTSKGVPQNSQISWFMNGINNPELIKRLNDRVPQSFDELIETHKVLHSRRAAAADSRKGTQTTGHRSRSRRHHWDQSSSRNNSYRLVRGCGRWDIGNDKRAIAFPLPWIWWGTDTDKIGSPGDETSKKEKINNGQRKKDAHRDKA
ncbi:hypothetical protein Tco_1319535 [Tanacetum coccineum]